MDNDLSTANAVAAVCGLTGHLGIDAGPNGVNPDDQAAVAALAAAATMESFSHSMLSQAAVANTTPPPRKKQRHVIHHDRTGNAPGGIELPGIPLPKGVQRSRKAFVGGFCSKGRRFSGPTRKTIEEALSDRLRLEQLGGDIPALEALAAELRAEVDDGDGRRSRGRKRPEHPIDDDQHNHHRVEMPSEAALMKMRRDALQGHQAAEAAAAAAALCGVDSDGTGKTLHTPAAQHLPEGVMLVSIGGLGNAFVAYQRADAHRIHILGPPRRTIVAAGDDYQAAMGLTSPPDTRGNRPINESILLCSGVGRVVTPISENELTSAYVGVIIVSGESCYTVGPIRETSAEAKNDLAHATGGILSAAAKAVPQPPEQMLDFGGEQVVDIDVHSGDDEHHGKGASVTVPSGLDADWVCN